MFIHNLFKHPIFPDVTYGTLTILINCFLKEYTVVIVLYNIVYTTFCDVLLATCLT